MREGAAQAVPGREIDEEAGAEDAEHGRPGAIETGAIPPLAHARHEDERQKAVDPDAERSLSPAKSPAGRCR